MALRNATSATWLFTAFSTTYGHNASSERDIRLAGAGTCVWLTVAAGPPLHGPAEGTIYIGAIQCYH